MLAVVALIVWRARDAREGDVQVFRGPTMGTSYLVKIDAPMTEADLERARVVIEERLDHVIQLMSTYDPESELSRFNRLSSTEPVRVSPDLLTVLAQAREVSTRSNGAFDVTVAPLVDAWGFGPPDGPVVPLDDHELASLCARVGYDRLVLDIEAGTVTKTHPDTVADLSAIAKGYAVERVAAGLIELGYDHVLVDVGGELKAVGRARDGTPWRVGIEAPDPTARRLFATVELTDLAAATSGDYRNHFKLGDVDYSHIIDPRTGRPLPFVGALVTVVHPDATAADAWATALTVAGPDRGYDLAVAENLAAMFVIRDGATFRSRSTPRFLELGVSFHEE